MKKFALLVLAALMVMTMLVACGGDSNSETSSEPTVKKSIKPPAGGFGDHTVTSDGLTGYGLSPTPDATVDASASPTASTAG